LSANENNPPYVVRPVTRIEGVGGVALERGDRNAERTQKFFEK